MTETQAAIRVFADGTLKVEPFIRQTDSTHIMCCTYEDQAPILAIDDGNVSVSLTVPDVHRVTGQDVNRAMALADAVARYITELGEHVADDDGAAKDAA
jgi:hypothetical protein